MCCIFSGGLVIRVPYCKLAKVICTGRIVPYDNRGIVPFVLGGFFRSIRDVHVPRDIQGAYLHFQDTKV